MKKIVLIIWTALSVIGYINILPLGMSALAFACGKATGSTYSDFCELFRWYMHPHWVPYTLIGLTIFAVYTQGAWKKFRASFPAKPKMTEQVPTEYL